jgi:hypothetical protein
MTIMKENIERMVLLMLALAGAFLLLPFASADSYELYCLGNGEQIDLASLCNPAMDTRTGPINLCMHLLDNGKICPTLINTCNSLGLSCSGNTNTTIDSDPPELIINSPIEGEIYTSRSVFINIESSEISTIHYIDLNEMRRGWKQICSRCSSYSRDRTFSEGLNELMFRVKDSSSNDAYYNVSFLVDSKDPRLSSVEPRNGFSDGEFFVRFTEINPDNLRIFYGNTDIGMRERSININDYCSNIEDDYECNFEIDLEDYDGREIQYYVEISDVAGNIDSSRVQLLDVDNTDPVILDFEYDIDGKYVTFILEIEEDFFKEVNYIDNSDRNPRERKLCSSLRDGICEKRVSFKDGEHDIDIFVGDEAGNMVGINVDFFIDSKDPKIKKTEPRRGFASGTFWVEFQEANPVELILYYGNDDLGENFALLDLEEDCNDINGNNENQKCSIDVDLDSYDGGVVEYYFRLVDIAGGEDESRRLELDVDTTNPVFDLINWTIDRNRAEVVISLTEENLDELLYINENDLRPRERTFCTRLRNGMCEKRIRLNEGNNRLNFMAYDDAGNAAAEGVEIFLP